MVSHALSLCSAFHFSFTSSARISAPVKAKDSAVSGTRARSYVACGVRFLSPKALSTQAALLVFVSHGPSLDAPVQRVGVNSPPDSPLACLPGQAFA